MTDTQIKLATTIDDHVNRVLAKGGGDEELLRSMVDQMATFKQLMEISSQEEMNTLCARSDGFFRFAKLLEAMAGGLADGSISAPE